MRALRREVGVVRSKVELLTAGLEPDAAGALEALRLGNLREPEQAAVEAPRLVLAAFWHGEERVVEGDDRAQRRY